MRPAHAARFGQGSSHAGCPSVAGDLRAIRTTRSDAGSSFSRDHGRPQCHAPDKLPAVLTPASALVVLSPSVVRIVGYGSGALGVFGTGVALGTKGHILTSYEVVKDAEDVFVAFGRGSRCIRTSCRPRLHDGPSHHPDRKRVAGSPAALGDSYAVEIGQEAVPIGYGFSRGDPVFARGVVTLTDCRYLLDPVTPVAALIESTAALYMDVTGGADGERHGRSHRHPHR